MPSFLKLLWEGVPCFLNVVPFLAFSPLPFLKSGMNPAMLSVDSVIVNYLCWKCLFVPEISSGNKTSTI